MRLAVLLAVLLSAMVVQASGITELNDNNFQNFVEQRAVTLVMFSAPWCKEHCQNLRKELAGAQGDLLKLNPPVEIAEIDIEDNTDTKEKYDISGVPQLMLFRDGESSSYRGKRHAANFIHYLSLMAGPAVIPVSTVEELQKWEEDPLALHFVLGLFPEGSTAASKVLQQVAADKRDDFIFLAATNPQQALLDRYGIKNSAPTVVVFKSWSKHHPAVFQPDEFSSIALTSFITEHSHPVLPMMDTTWAKYVNGRNLPVARVVIDGLEEDRSNLDDEGVAARVQVVKDIMDHDEWRGKVVFTLSTHSKSGYQIQNMGLQDVRNLIIVSKFGEKDKFVYEYEWEANVMATWFHDWASQRIRPWIKSAPIPEHHDGHVVEVVGKTFHDIVLSSDKDVLIEFYAPWCGHCKKLAPVYRKLAKKFRKVKSVVIAKMDATANDWPEKDIFEVSGYPTLFFVRGGSVSAGVSKYQYARDVSTMKEYIKLNAGIPFEFPKKKSNKHKNGKEGESKTNVQDQKKEENHKLEGVKAGKATADKGSGKHRAQ